MDLRRSIPLVWIVAAGLAPFGCSGRLAAYDTPTPVPASQREEAPSAEEPAAETPADQVRTLLAEHVPEIRAGTVVVKAIARVVGRRTKVALASNDASIDPIGVSVGEEGARIRLVVAAMHGEAIDLVPWDADVVRFVSSAVAPVHIARIEVDDDAHAMTLVVADEDLATLRDIHLALAAELVGWRLHAIGAGQPEPARVDDGQSSERHPSDAEGPAGPDAGGRTTPP